MEAGGRKSKAARKLAVSDQLVSRTHTNPRRPDDARTAEAGGIDHAVLVEYAGQHVAVIATLPNQLCERRTVSSSGKR